MAESQRGKKFNDDIKEKALALLATNNNAQVVADTLGLKYTTVKTWEKKLLKDAQDKENSKANDFVELRNKKKKEFVDEAWKIIGHAQQLLARRLERALLSETEIDNLVDEIMQLDYQDLNQEQRKALYKKVAAIKVEDVGKIATVLGTIYDKQALANGEATSIEEQVVKKFEDFN